MVLLHHLLRHFGAVSYQSHNLSVDFRSHLLGVGTQVLSLPETNVAQVVVHPQLSHNTMSYFVGPLQVISRPVCAGSKEVLLGTSSTQNETDLIDQLSLSVQLVFTVQILGKAECSLRARDDGEFQEWVGSF